MYFNVLIVWYVSISFFVLCFCFNFVINYDNDYDIVRTLSFVGSLAVLLLSWDVAHCLYKLHFSTFVFHLTFFFLNVFNYSQKLLCLIIKLIFFFSLKPFFMRTFTLQKCNLVNLLNRFFFFFVYLSDHFRSISLNQ